MRLLGRSGECGLPQDKEKKDIYCFLHTPENKGYYHHQDSF
jgi:hypothetical protein